MMRKTVLSLLLILYAASPLFADADELIKTIQNPLLSVTDRKKAVEEFKTFQDSRMTSVLSSVIQNQEEPIRLRSYLVDVLIASNDKWSQIELSKIMKNPRVDKQARQLAIHALWHKNKAQVQEDLMEIGRNQSEDMDVRSVALALLRNADFEKWPPQYWQNLYRPGNPAPVRIAALNGMEDAGLMETEKPAIMKTIQDKNSDAAVRKHGILMMERNYFPEEIESVLLNIISNPLESLDMRRFSLDHLVNYTSPASVSKLEQLFLEEKNSTFKKDLGTFLDNLSDPA